MDITWYGQSCFRLKDRNVTVVTDPYGKVSGLKLPRLTADIVTVSHGHQDHNNVAAVRGEPFVVDGPGEYEVAGLFVSGVSMWHDDQSGAKRGRNTIFIYYFSDATVCHLGDLGHVPTQAQVEEMGNVDVLLVPVGGTYTIDARQAVEVVSLIEPSVVIPMHYALPGMETPLESVDAFLKEMGVREPERMESYSVVGKRLPEETQVVVLESRSG
ncbi:MAG: MBL fold metallo-hydrolase [Anaerolineae bacterium]|jgi:L-ascorbate metabolism protein UlaG (beta-lactamase superfamily)